MGAQRLIPVHSGAVTSEALAAQIERILESSTFRNSEALRRLLRFLADKMLSGDADQLKEYSVGIDALGKPASYDPRRDSTVRIQVGRLRQKLTDYYASEGADDAVIVDLPKGHFKVTGEIRPAAAVAAVEVEAVPAVSPARVPSLADLPLSLSPVSIKTSYEEKAPEKTAGKAVLILGVLLVLTAVWGTFMTVEFLRERETSAMVRTTWTPELDQLWGPVLTSRRPLIVSIADPPFVQFKGFGAYRDLTLNTWDDLIHNPAVGAIRKALNNAEVQRNVYYAPIGEVSASFLIGKLLGPRVPTLSLLRASELSLQQIADNNVLFIGAPVFFEQQLRGSPIQLDLINQRPGIHNNRPRKGEPSVLSDQLPDGASEDGEAYVLVTHVPGPLRTTEIVSFTSNRTPGRLTAVEWFTNPAYARTLVGKMRKPSGEIPRYYQVVLKVKYKGGVPTETTYILHHELQ